jgi:hypothetical protein
MGDTKVVIYFNYRGKTFKNYSCVEFYVNTYCKDLKKQMIFDHITYAYKMFEEINEIRIEEVSEDEK